MEGEVARESKSAARLWPSRCLFYGSNHPKMGRITKKTHKRERIMKSRIILMLVSVSSSLGER